MQIFTNFVFFQTGNIQNADSLSQRSKIKDLQHRTSVLTSVRTNVRSTRCCSWNADHVAEAVECVHEPGLVEVEGAIRLGRTSNCFTNRNYVRFE